MQDFVESLAALRSRPGRFRLGCPSFVESPYFQLFERAPVSRLRHLLQCETGELATPTPIHLFRVYLDPLISNQFALSDVHQPTIAHFVLELLRMAPNLRSARTRTTVPASPPATPNNKAKKYILLFCLYIYADQFFCHRGKGRNTAPAIMNNAPHVSGTPAKKQWVLFIPSALYLIWLVPVVSLSYPSHQCRRRARSRPVWSTDCVRILTRTFLFWPYEVIHSLSYTILTRHGHLTMEDYLSFSFSFLLYSFVFHFPLFLSSSSHASFPKSSGLSRMTSFHHWPLIMAFPKV